jgi:putative ATP-binding cassette transporter
LIRIYWVSPDAKWGALLLAAAVALELGTVRASVLVSQAQRRMVEGLESRDPQAFAVAIGSFVGLLLLFVFVSNYRVYLRQLLEIRWRRGLTADFLSRWIDTKAYGQRQLHGGELDNPDQRIAEDIRDFVASALGLSLSLLAAITTLVSFGGLLWSLSAGWQLPLRGRTLAIPGLLLWVAIGFASFSMFVTHLMGRRLVPINFDRFRFEADFRYGLVRFRDHVEQVALSGGEGVERLGAVDRFRRVVDIFIQLVRAERNLNLLTGSIGQMNSIVPILVAAPAYFANLLTLGMIVQTRVAYDQVSGSLSWLVNAYREIARWRANIERLAAFEDVMDATDRELEAAALKVVPAPAGAIRLADVRLETPTGRVLVDRADAQLAAGERVAIVGEAGAGKTTLFRALAGIWPFGQGRVERPPRQRMLFVPQQAYFPIGTLRAAVSYPDAEGTFPDSRIVEVLELLGLGYLAPQIGEVAPWEQRTSVHEQQLLAIARVLLHEPDWVLLDEATAALDEASERKLYELVLARLPRTSVVSLGARPGVLELLPRRLALTAGEDGKVVLRAA